MVAKIAAGQIALTLDDGSTKIVTEAEAVSMAAQANALDRIAHRDAIRSKAELAKRATYEAHMGEFFEGHRKAKVAPTLAQINEARAQATTLSQKAARTVYTDNGYKPCVRSNCAGGPQRNLATPGYAVCRPCYDRDQANKG